MPNTERRAIIPSPVHHHPARYERSAALPVPGENTNPTGVAAPPARTVTGTGNLPRTPVLFRQCPYGLPNPFEANMSKKLATQIGVALALMGSVAVASAADKG